MKKILSFIAGLFIIVSLSGQTTIYNDLILQKTTPMLHLYGTGAYINFNNGDLLLTRTSNLLTLSGGDLSLGANNLLITGSIGATGSRILKGWFTNLELTNVPTIAGVSISSIYSPINSPTFTGTIIMPATTSIGTVSSTEIGYLDNVTSALQTQLNAKAPIANPNFTGSARLASDSLMTNTRVNQKIEYIVDSLIDNGVDLETYVDGRLADFGGGGGSLGMYELRGIIGTTSGFPEDGDSVVTNSGFTDHPHILVYRDGAIQWYNQGLTVNNAIGDAFVFNSSTGAVTVKPIFQDGEKVIIHAFDPIVWNTLIPVGEESSLLDSILFYYALDEISGTTAVDATGTQNGTTTATANQAGKIGRSQYFDEDVINVPTNASLVVDDQSVSISLWINCSTLPSALSHEGYLVRAGVTTSPWESIYLTVGTDNKIYFHVKNTAETDYEVASTDAISADTWYHVVAVADGAAALKLYVNGSDVSAGAETLAGSIFENNHYWFIGDAFEASGSDFAGYIDEVFVTDQGLTSGDVTTLYNSGSGLAYPF